ncbi:MAG TPA: hypothetical protein VFV99_05135 [Kofleriaceae bacterium]|nr:hypothetical protein [Kofleriaceae bacterium]
MRALYLVLLLALLAADSPPSGGSVSGTVLAIQNSKVVSRKQVYVYLLPLGKHDARPGAGIKKQIVQKNRQFSPRVVVVPVGAQVWFPNADRDRHNVYSPTEPTFDLGIYGPNAQGKDHVFEDEAEFDIYCDIHRFMSAKVKVVDSPYIVQAVNGKFSFSGIAPGKYRVIAWGPNSTEVKYPKEITVTAGGSVALDRELHLQIKTPPLCHDRLDGTEYDKNEYGKCPPDFD